MAKIFKNFKELTEANPEWVGNKDGDSLERPDIGWIDVNKECFHGTGYHGYEGGYYKDEWQTWNRKNGNCGHIPTNGYG